MITPAPPPRTPLTGRQSLLRCGLCRGWTTPTGSTWIQLGDVQRRVHDQHLAHIPAGQAKPNT